MIESMRAIGYSLESAVADIIDNSISAGASEINVYFTPNNEPFIAIIDDGCGMNADELTESMRHGGRSLNVQRKPTDLGRFGLGLKTASLSQCRKLTVISKRDQDTKLSARVWDMDLIEKKKDWVLYIPDSDAEIYELPYTKLLLEQGHGTIVLWQQLDRLAAGETGILEAFDEKMPRVREHLSLVFHRYLSGDGGLAAIQINMNNESVVPADPYFLKSKATQQLYTEHFTVENQTIQVTPYILPHVSKLTEKERKKLAANNDFRMAQGFYVYRNSRLILYGTWFKMARTDELTKLARVQVDIPNTLDHLWTLDVKKSSVYPPEEVRSNLKRIIERIASHSIQVYNYRGLSAQSKEVIHTWNRVETRTGIIYRINRDHPVIKDLLSAFTDRDKRSLMTVLDVLESTYPVNALYNDAATEQTANDEGMSEKELRDLASQLYAAAQNLPDKGRSMIERLPFIEPFSYNADVTQQIMGELKNVE
jgi:hypothetical protein